VLPVGPTSAPDQRVARKSIRPGPGVGGVGEFGGERRAFKAGVDVLGARLPIPGSLFRTIQETLKYPPRGFRYLTILRTMRNGRRHVDVNLLGM